MNWLQRIKEDEFEKIAGRWNMTQKDVMRALYALGYQPEQVKTKGRGSHQKFFIPGGRYKPSLPMGHSRKSISIGTLRQIMRGINQNDPSITPEQFMNAGRQ